jgi:hypothetical protein
MHFGNNVSNTKAHHILAKKKKNQDEIMIA